MKAFSAEAAINHWYSATGTGDVAGGCESQRLKCFDVSSKGFRILPYTFNTEFQMHTHYNINR